MTWVCVGFSGKELVCQGKPTRYNDRYWMMRELSRNSLEKNYLFLMSQLNLKKSSYDKTLQNQA